VTRGDRVAALLPNVPEALVLFLATASLGAIWSSCAPEFGVPSVLDRFSQISPKVLLTVDAYSYGGKRFDKRAAVEEIARGLPSLEHVVLISKLGQGRLELPHVLSIDELLAHDAPLAFLPVPFDHPLWVLYSSGTTGLPKPIVQGHGGILLEHLKALGLHCDLGPADKFFWFTTTGWMMWNFLISGLLVEATVVLYDGSPAHPSLSALWRLAERERITYFGTSAPYLTSCQKAELSPGTVFDLSCLRAVGSTGAPLPSDGFAWVYEHVSRELSLASVSGGTDVCTAFVLGCPMLPVRVGEIQCAGLGCAVAAFDPEGHAVVGEVGELVLTAPLPSMPLFFWGDDDGSRLFESYFSTFEGVWRHGDWVKATASGGWVIYGRSDSTLNRGGVRMGTSEFYRVVEALPEVADSLVVDTGEKGQDGKLWLFLVPAPGHVLDDDLRRKLKARLRAELSPRHVPDEFRQVRAIPRTLSGKKLEVPIKRIFAGVPVERAVSRDTLKDPSAIDEYLAFRDEV
jgi:acetoacetyl-CoA synthetase